jgi:hypothetical protein
MNVKNWANLLASVMRFYKSILILPHVYHICKKNMRMRQKDQYDKSELLYNRFSIILKFFELLMRVERTIRNTASKCLKELLKKESHPRELLSNDDKLKLILRPVLICL